jgi:septal ring factor EnvC (AmiA/AmiB activator)
VNPEVVAQLILTVGVVPTLLVFLVYSDRKERKEEREKSQDRERQLMDHISKSDETLNQFAASLAKIGDTLNGMDKSMGYLQRDVEELKAK